jgi:hypothetical protein
MTFLSTLKDLFKKEETGEVKTQAYPVDINVPRNVERLTTRIETLEAYIKKGKATAEHHASLEKHKAALAALRASVGLK